jgi:hypothetical protein
VLNYAIIIIIISKDRTIVVFMQAISVWLYLPVAQQQHAPFAWTTPGTLFTLDDYLDTSCTPEEGAHSPSWLNHHHHHHHHHHRYYLYNNREGDPKEWSTVLITALGSWETTVPRGHTKTGLMLFSCRLSTCGSVQWLNRLQNRDRRLFMLSFTTVVVGFRKFAQPSSTDGFL